MAIALASEAPRESRGRRKQALRIAVDGPSDHLLKVSEYGALPFWRRLGRSRARRDLACAEHLARHGLATPAPVAVGELRAGLLLDRSFEVLPWLDDAIDLGRALAEHRATAPERRSVASAFGALVRRLHDAGLDQGDLAPNNFLWRPGASPALLAVDFERARLRSRVSSRARIAALAKLHRYCGAASTADRMRFARAYAGGDLAAARQLWRDVEHAARDLLAHDVRRWHHAATRAGRRFEPLSIDLAGEDGAGVVRRGVAPDALRRAWADPMDAAWIVHAVGARSPRDAYRLFAVALALAQRGLALRPDAVVVTADRAHLVYERPAGVVRLVDSSAAEAAPAITVVLARLLALGAIAHPIDRSAFAISRDARHAWLLAAESFDAATRAPDRTAARRAILESLAPTRQ